MRHAFRFALPLLLALAALTAPVAAQNRTAFDVMDSRGALLGWEAVGRLDMPGGFCTGALIAQDLVLTAAHCVHDRQSGAAIPAERLLFRAGYHRGTQIVERRVTRWVEPEAYTRERGRGNAITPAAIAHDVALLKLDRPIFSSEADPFRLFQGSTPGRDLTVVSYGRGRSEVLSRQASCAVTRHYVGDIMGFDCDVTFGSSGAPVFLREDGLLRIVSVVSSITVDSDTFEAYGPSLPALVSELRAELRREDARPSVSAGARRITVGSGRDGIGARFVKP